MSLLRRLGTTLFPRSKSQSPSSQGRTTAGSSITSKLKTMAKKTKDSSVPECSNPDGHRTVAMGQNEDGSFNVKCNECHHEWTADTFDG